MSEGKEGKNRCPESLKRGKYFFYNDKYQFKKIDLK